MRTVGPTFCFCKRHTGLHRRTQNPTKQNATIRDAYTQICTRYMRDIPALLKYCALAVISDGAKNKLGTPYTPFEFFYEWKKIDNEDKAGKGLDTLRTLVRGALSPERILEILRDYVYFPDPTKEDDTTEVVCRYPQFFATRKLRDHILSHLRSVGGVVRGHLFRRHRVWKDLYHAVPCSPVGTALPRATG